VYKWIKNYHSHGTLFKSESFSKAFKLICNLKSENLVDECFNIFLSYLVNRNTQTNTQTDEQQPSHNLLYWRQWVEIQSLECTLPWQLSAQWSTTVYMCMYWYVGVCVCMYVCMSVCLCVYVGHWTVSQVLVTHLPTSSTSNRLHARPQVTRLVAVREIFYQLR